MKNKDWEGMIQKVVSSETGEGRCQIFLQYNVERELVQVKKVKRRLRSFTAFVNRLVPGNVERLGVLVDQRGLLQDRLGVLLDGLGVLLDCLWVLLDRLGVLLDGFGILLDRLGVLLD